MNYSEKKILSRILKTDLKSYTFFKFCSKKLKLENVEINEVLFYTFGPHYDSLIKRLMGDIDRKHKLQFLLFNVIINNGYIYIIPSNQNPLSLEITNVYKAIICKFPKTENEILDFLNFLYKENYNYRLSMLNYLSLLKDKESIIMSLNDLMLYFSEKLHLNIKQQIKLFFTRINLSSMLCKTINY